jgi:hypothetical protein
LRGAPEHGVRRVAFVHQEGKASGATS